MVEPNTNTDLSGSAIHSTRTLRIHLGNTITKLDKLRLEHDLDTSEIHAHIVTVHDHLYAQEIADRQAAEKGGAQ